MTNLRTTKGSTPSIWYESQITRMIINEDIIDIQFLLADRTIDLGINDYHLVKLADQYNRRRILRLMSKHVSVATPKRPNLDVLNIILNSLSGKTNLYLEKILIHPQGEYYGLNKNKTPTSALLSFLSDLNNVGTLMDIKSMGNEPQNFAKINEAILGNLAKESGCVTSLFVHNKPSKEMKKAFDLILFSDDNQDDNYKYFQVWITKRKTLRRILDITQKSISRLKECYDNGAKYISIGIQLIITNEYVHSDVIYIPNSAHMTQIFLDITDRDDVRVILLEPSITGGKEKYEIFEREFSREIVKIVRKILGTDNIRYITFAQEACPLFSIQGLSGTCVYWSLYLFYLYILNNRDRSKVYQILKNVDLKYRNRLLSQFIYYIGGILDYPIGGIVDYPQSVPKLARDLSYLKTSWS